MDTPTQFGDGAKDAVEGGAAAVGRLEPYADPDRPGVIRLPIASGKHEGMVAIIDAGDLPLVRRKRWNWSPASYGRTGGGSVVQSSGGAALARVIMGVTDRDMLVSHVNGDRFDCRRENLVVRTRSEVKRAAKPPTKWEGFKPYADPDRPGVWRVPLRSHLAHRDVLVDEADLPVVAGRNWNWSPRSDGAVEGTVILATSDGRHVPLHRLIAGVADPRVRVSFANGDPLDCRRGNLVFRSLAETAQGTRKASTRGGKECTSRFKGVSRHADRGLWAAQITKGKVHMCLGRFDREDEAARAYDAAARVLFGEHGHLNFPDEPSTEQALAEARQAMDGGSNRVRADRRRQRGMERELRRAAAGGAGRAGSADDGGGDGRVLLGDTARQLFDVSTSVWRRWGRFGWVPAPVTGDEGETHPLEAIARLLRECGIVALPYPDPERPGCFRVPLSGETARGREALVDADAVALVETRRWRFAAMATRRGGEVQTMIPSENIRLHQVVMGVSGDESPIGFRNGDPLDCRRANLVVRDWSETQANRRKAATFRGRPCTSRFKGVFWDARRKRWTAKIKKNGVSRSLGNFGDEIAAAQAYDEAARELHGEHARPNFPDGVDAWLERAAA